MSDLNFLFSSELRKCSFQPTRPSSVFRTEIEDVSEESGE